MQRQGQGSVRHWVLGAVCALSAAVPVSAYAKSFQVYSHPDATAAPTKGVAVKDLQPSHVPSELENIVGQTADRPRAAPRPASAKPAQPVTQASGQAVQQPAADAAQAIPELEAQEAPLPAPVPPLQIIPPPSELLAEAEQEQEPEGILYRMQAWAETWQELIYAVTMIGLFCFSGILMLTGRRQYHVLQRSVGAAEQSAAAAMQAAEAAQLSSLMQTSLERPYVFLEPNIQGSVGGGNDKDEPAQFTIKFSFRNHGKTPAVIADLQASGSYWATGYPDALYATSHTASQGMIMSPGDKSAPFTLVFNVDVQDLEKAYNGTGQLLFWGKLLYRDMFGEMRETAFCRNYNFDEKAFRMALAESLNYHT